MVLSDEEKIKALEKYMFLFSISENSQENFDNELLNKFDKILKQNQ